MDGVVYLDLETTGLGAADEIIEIGALKINGGKELTYQQLVNPSAGHISPRIFKLCRGITEMSLRKSPCFVDIQEEFLGFIGDFPLICHNAAFEKRMLEKVLGGKLENILLDSLELFCLFKPHFPSHGLQYLLQYYMEEARPEAHRALADARDTMKLVQKLRADLADKDYDLLEATLQKMHGTKWGWLPSLQKIAPATLKQVTSTAPAADHEAPRCVYTPDDIASLLKDEKIWQKYFPGYAFRPQQLQMALATADAFRGRQAVFVEAPTGSGKTLAYLLAALLFAVNEKEQVFISTNTKNLQQQVLDDLPGVAAALDLENLRFTDMKGIANYACRRRMAEETESPGSDLETKLAQCYLSNWVRRTPTGLLEDLSYWFRVSNPALNPLLDAVSCRREDCAGIACRYKDACFYRRKVELMKKAHLCLINHSLFLTWPGGYPELKRLIIDEAHALEEKCFDAFTRELSSRELAQFLGRLFREGHRGYVHYLLFHGRKVLPALGVDPALHAIDLIRQYAQDISLLLEPLQNGKYSRRMPIPKNSDGLAETVLALASGLDTLARFLEGIMDEISFKDEDFSKMALYRQGKEYLGICHAWSALLENCFAEEEDENSFCYLECSRFGWCFRIAPLDVASLFHGRILSGCDSMLLTSATLAERGGYGRPARALGFDRLEAGRVAFVDPLPDVYNYCQNSVLAIPADSPGYQEDVFVDYAARAVTGAAKVLGGRTMALFTSLERMHKVLEKVRAPLEKEGISILGGENSSRRGDLEHFRADENAVLFGSRGFFEGVDVSGPALSCIIIDKLSFPFHDDPVIRARARYMEKEGLNPFDELLLAAAKRTLRQQFGRLIRAETDKGFVLVLDQLAGGKRYCRSTLKELPNPQVIRDVSLDEIIEFMKEKFTEWGYETS